MSCSKPLQPFVCDSLYFLKRNQLERFSIACRPLKNYIERYLHSKPYRVFDELYIRGGSYALCHNDVFWHPNRDDYSVQQFLANQECSSIKRQWDDPAYYSFADMLPYLGATVRIEVTEITVAEDLTYNPEHIEQMESIVHLWREYDVNIQNYPFRRIAGQYFQPIFNSATILQCRYLTMNNAHLSFKDYNVLYTVKAIRIFHTAVDAIDLWQQFIEQPKIKPVVVFCCSVDFEFIEILLDRLSKDFSSATSPNTFKIAFVQNHGSMAEFRETNNTSGEILELKEGISVELLIEPLKNFYTCTLERFSI